MIAIVDYGIGNLGSVTKAFRHVGAESVLSGDPAVLRRADALILPGDGAFGATMDEVRSRGLVPVLHEAASSGKPLLGICIGMQLLFEESEEHGRHAGLSLLPGRVRRFPDPLVVPHMGWNSLAPHRSAHPSESAGPDRSRSLRDLGEHALLDGIDAGSYVYFVHSYFCDAPADVVLAYSDYGKAFPAIVGRDNILGVQFHPEKSQGVGIKMIENFVRFVSTRRPVAHKEQRA
jgi:imidazole glycerol-phosphate synthase subunit HisH